MNAVIATGTLLTVLLLGACDPSTQLGPRFETNGSYFEWLAIQHEREEMKQLEVAGG